MAGGHSGNATGGPGSIPAHETLTEKNLNEMSPKPRSEGPAS